MIHPALRLLIRLQFRGVLRRTGRAMRTPKGATFAIIGGLMLLLWLGSVFFSATLGRKTDPQRVRELAPALLLLVCAANVFGGGDKVISFTPGEINFLFPGPFTRRQLTAYKLAKTVLGTLAAAAFFAFVLLPHSGGYVAAFLGAFLGMLFMHLLTLSAVMTGQVVGERAYTRGRRLVLIALGVALAVAVAPTLAAVSQTGLKELVAGLQRSRTGAVLLAPFTVFTRIFTAQSADELLTWSAVAAAINAALLLLVVRLDADYLEAAATASHRVWERAQRMRGGSRAGSPSAPAEPAPGTGKSRRRRRPAGVPMLPWLGGAGPTAWRQLTTVVRTSRGTLFALLFVFGAIVWIVSVGKGNPSALVPAGAWATLFLSTMLKLDFRGDLDQLAWLKSQPLHPTATAAGQLVVPVLLLTLIHVALLVAGAVLASPEHRRIVLVVALFVLPFNVLLLAVENALFLLFPSRTAGAAPGDLGQMGRGIVFFFLKMLTVSIAAGVSAALGGIAGALSGGSVVVGVAVALLALIATAAASVPFVGWAYHHFDPSADTPA